MSEAETPRPEEGWDRRTPIVALDAETIRRLLLPVSMGSPLASFMLMGGGLANTNYRVRLEGDPEYMLLRLYTRDPEACAREEALLDLVDGSVPAPEVLFADPEAKSWVFPYAVLSWVEGVPLLEALQRDPEAPRQVGKAVGRTLSGIHAIGFERGGFFAPDLSFRDPEGLDRPALLDYVEASLFQGAGASQLGEEFAAEVWQFLQAHAGLLPGDDGPAVLVHGDYKAGNILMRATNGGGWEQGTWHNGDWEVAGVLDWEFAFAGSPLFDLAILLRYSEQLPPQFEQGVIAGYQAAGGWLPVDWRQRIRLLDFVNLCDFVAQPERGEALIADVRGLLAATMRDWDDYAADAI